MVTGIDSFKEWFKGSEEQGVYADIQEFVQRMKNENVDIKQLGWLAEQRRRFWKN